MAIFSTVRVIIGGSLVCAMATLVSPFSLADELVAKTFPVKDFTEVILGGDAIVDVTQDGTEYLRVEASPEVMERVKVDLSGKRLTLGVKHKGGMFGWFQSHEDQVHFILRVKQLTYMELSGAARGRFGDFQSEKFKLEASGAAGAEFAAVNVGVLGIGLSGASNLAMSKVNSQKLDFDLSGASNLEIKQISNANDVKVDVSGASNLHARHLSAQNAVLDASGASHIEISVVEKLNAEASGASGIDYYGNPKAQTDASGASHVNAHSNE